MEDKHPLRRLLHSMGHHRRAFLWASFCSVTNKVFDLAPPVLIGAAVDVVVRGEASAMASLGISDPVHQLAGLVIASLIIWGAESAFQYAYDVAWRTIAQTVQHEIRLDAYAHIQDLDMAWFSEQRTGDLLSVLNDDVNQLERFLDHGANDLLQVATTVLVVGAIFFTVSVPIALVAIVPIPIILWGSFRFQTRIQPRYAKVRNEVGRLNATLENNLQGIATIKSFTGEASEADRIRTASEAYMDANASAIRLSASFVPLIRMAILVGFCATLFIGGRMALGQAPSGAVLEVGAYSVLVFLTQRLLWPLTRLGETFDLYQRAMASTARILRLLDTPIGIVDGGRTPERIEGDIRFKGLSFGYPGRPMVLDAIDLSIEPNTTVGIVGPTGSGKTTLMRLLLRFHDADEGAVLLDGEDVRSLDLQALRRAISFVSQRITLFPDTVAGNIRYGRPGATDEEVRAAARVAEAEAFIDALPEGMETEIGEGGHRLSGGQRQRLSIARAVLKDAPILVLDEATSAVDNETEAALQRSMERIRTGRTTIVIAHRLSTVRSADVIHVLSDGSLEESGTHDELLALNGIYARLWAVQTGVRYGDDEALLR